MSKPYDRPDDMDDMLYIARQLQEQTQLLREILELSQYAYKYPKLYGLWSSASNDWGEDENNDVFSSPYPQLMKIYEYLGAEVREIGVDGLPVPIEEVG